MRKILLLASVMISLCLPAQNITGLVDVKRVSESFRTLPACSPRTDMMSVKAQADKPAKAPAGDVETFYLEYYDRVYGFENLCVRSHVKSDFIFGNDGKVYIPNMFFMSQLPGYIEGTLSGNTITVSGAHNAGTVGENTYYVSQVDPETGSPKNEAFTLTKDPATGIWKTDGNTLLGLYVDELIPENLYSYCAMLNYLPAGAFPASVQCRLTAVDNYDRNISKTLEVIKVEDGYYIKGLMRGYDDSWVVGLYGENGDIKIPSYQVLGDDVAAVFVDELNYNQPEGLFVYDAEADTHSLQDNISLMDMYSDNGTDFYATQVYARMTISGLSADISDVKADRKIVGTEYFDLSGRRVSDAYKGLIIRVTRYADGTSSAEKIMK